MIVSNIQPVASGTQPDLQPFTSGGGQQVSADDFLQLLTVQLANQDPLEPVKDTDFLAQMAQFSSLEQMNDLRRSIDGMATLQTPASAQLLLGREIVASDANGSVRGVVTAVEIENGSVWARVGDSRVSLETIEQIVQPVTNQG